jgi:hypothetical protein
MQDARLARLEQALASSAGTSMHTLLLLLLLFYI